MQAADEDDNQRHRTDEVLHQLHAGPGDDRFDLLNHDDLRCVALCCHFVLILIPLSKELFENICEQNASRGRAHTLTH